MINAEDFLKDWVCLFLLFKFLNFISFFEFINKDLSTGCENSHTDNTIEFLFFLRISILSEMYFFLTNIDVG